MPQAPLICIFQCRLRIPSGRFLPGDVLWVIQNLHEVRSGFCKRIVLHLFRNRRIQKQNAPHLHTVRKFFLCLQCRLLTHIRVSFCIQNVGCGVFSVAVFRQLHHGVVLIPKVTEANPATDVLFHSFPMRGLGQRHDVPLHQPAQNHLGDRLAMGFADFRQSRIIEHAGSPFVEWRPCLLRVTATLCRRDMG